MKRINGVEIENAEQMTEVERLRACFEHITNTAIGNLQNDLEVAKAMGDKDNKKLYHIQIGMFKHAQSIFQLSLDYATDKGWHNEKATT